MFYLCGTLLIEEDCPRSPDSSNIEMVNGTCVHGEVEDIGHEVEKGLNI